MCLFPQKNRCNNQSQQKAYSRGLVEFTCGRCPECLATRSNRWALRGIMESRLHAHSCMVTLTYDKYVRGRSGNIIGERIGSFHLCRPDIVKFIKRLRSYFSYHFGNTNIKYIYAGEYGSHTGRAHYHVVLFGVLFPDLCKYKRSKRGNIIYTSAILTKLWGHGICTVDSVSVNGSIAAYCTKYAAKSRADDTFMGASKGLGLPALMASFNGKSYIVDGREYPVPRLVWQKYIENKYSDLAKVFSFKYVKPQYESCMIDDDGVIHHDIHVGRLLNAYDYYLGKKLNQTASDLLRSDPLYVGYLDYWKNKNDLISRPSCVERILALRNDKYFFYKKLAIQRLGLYNRLMKNHDIVEPSKVQKNLHDACLRLPLLSYKRRRQNLISVDDLELFDGLSPWNSPPEQFTIPTI